MDSNSSEIKDRIREAYNAMVRNQPGFRSRPSQRRMIAEIAKTLLGEYDSRILAIEGPTGVGKSLSYIIAALPIALALDKTLIISTSTIALQDQLCSKDLPQAAKIAGLAFSFELIKGRGRYVCERNLFDALAYTDTSGDEGGQASLHGLWTVKPRDGEPEQVEQMAEAWNDGLWDGDFDTWDGPPVRREVQEMLASTRLSCSKRRCEFYDSCAFFAARQRARQAQVLIANHSLVVSDLLMGGGVLLPDPGDALFVFDEGHALHTRALAQTAASTTVLGSMQWLKNLPTVARQVGDLLPRSAHRRFDTLFSAIVRDHDNVNTRLRDLHTLLTRIYPAADEAGATAKDASRKRRSDKRRAGGAEGGAWRFKLGVVDDAPLLDVSAETRVGAGALRKSTASILAQLDQAIKDEEVTPDEAASVMPSLVWIFQRIDAMHEALKGFATPDDGVPDIAPSARWIERCGNDGRDFRVCVSSTSPAAFLEEALWERCYGAIITSATLTSLGRFSRLREQLGLTELPIQTCRLPSPFAYRSHAELHVPLMHSLPTDKHAHTEEVVHHLSKELARSLGTLVLFSSNWQMREVRDGLPGDIRKHVLMQGEAPRQVIIDAHRERIEAGLASYIFGVASYAEGLDLPGALCEHVVVVKIPFNVPTSPVDATYAEWLESVGRNPFMEMSVPDASLRLIQACGRLIRSEEDHGRVTILDRRLVTKRYGQSMLQALPPFRQCIEADASVA